MNQKLGFSLIELILVMSGLAGLALVGMQVIKNQSKSVVKLSFDSDALGIVNEINSILTDPDKCLKTLGGKNALSTNSGITSINTTKDVAAIDTFKYFSLENVPTPTSGYGNSNLFISNYSLRSTIDEVNANNSTLYINFQNKNILKGSSGPVNLTKKINLYVQVDGSNNITKCRSLTQSSSDIWTRGNGNDIYYNAGNVGIGKVQPRTALDVAGAITPGDETQATVCNNQTEGSIRYNKLIRRLEFCGYNAGPPASFSWKSATISTYSPGAFVCIGEINWDHHDFSSVTCTAPVDGYYRGLDYYRGAVAVSPRFYATSGSELKIQGYWVGGSHGCYENFMINGAVVNGGWGDNGCQGSMSNYAIIYSYDQ